jgi:L-asparaginase
MTSMDAYGGSEVDLLSRGLISSGAVDAAAARVLLRLLLKAHASLATIAEAFQQALAPQGLKIVSPQGAIGGRD